MDRQLWMIEECEKHGKSYPHLTLAPAVGGGDWVPCDGGLQRTPTKAELFDALTIFEGSDTLIIRRGENGKWPQQILDLMYEYKATPGQSASYVLRAMVSTARKPVEGVEPQ